MKKLLISALSCLMIISVFSSCEKKQNEEPKPNDKKTGFTIDIANVTVSSANVTFTPINMEVTYIYGLLPTEQYNEDSILAAYNKDFLEKTIKEYSEFFQVNVYYADLFTVGVKEEKYEGLTPETDYTVVALGIDTLTFEISAPITTKTFRTLKWETTGEMNIQVSSVEAGQALVSVTPSNPNITYVYDVVPTQDFDEQSLKTRYTKAFFDDIIEYYSYVYDEPIYYGDIFYKGAEKELFKDLTPETDYTVFAVGVDTVSFLLSTPIATATFRTLPWEKKGEKSIEMLHLTFMDHVADYGWWQLFGSSAWDNGNFYYLTVSPNEASTVTGTYTLEDMDLDYTYLRYYSVIGNDTTHQDITFLDGTFNVTATETGATMDAEVKGNDGYIYTLHVVGTPGDDEEEFAPARRNVTVRRSKALGVKKAKFQKH